VGDQVRVEAALADALGVQRWACVVGGSMGGMRALEWAVALPDRVATLFFLASGAVATAELRPRGPARRRARHRPADRAPHLPQRVRAR
jgi:homoserine acetyltransferase